MGKKPSQARKEIDIQTPLKTKQPGMLRKGSYRQPFGRHDKRDQKGKKSKWNPVEEVYNFGLGGAIGRGWKTKR